MNKRYRKSKIIALESDAKKLAKLMGGVYHEIELQNKTIAYMVEWDWR